MTSLKNRRTMRSLKRQDGQGMTEYIIIVALIAIAAIGVVTVFGQDIRMLFGASTAALSGDTSVRSNAQAANKQMNAKKTLKNFGQTNAGN
jgi:pilus assembly protein Flp/PilA